MKILIVSLFSSFCIILAGCTNLSSRSDVTSSATSNEDSSEAPLVELKEIQSFRMSDPEPPQVSSQELDTIPIEINASVEKWLNYFQGRGRPHMERYLSRANRYEKLMKRILKQNGLPEDLFYVALIESGFSSKATSHASAVGYWQFIRGTGKRYGLEINSLVDERRDPILSTQAAAEYFKGLYSVFGSWYLALASYNVGENRVKREVMNHYTRDFWELARKRRLPKETMNYVPKFIAAKLIGRDPKKYGFTDIEYLSPIEFESIKVATPVNLKVMAEKMDLDYDDFKALNPKFRGEIAPLKDGKSFELRVPLAMTEKARLAAVESQVNEVVLIADAGDTKTYRVRSGDSLSTIAKRNRTTVAWLRETNNLSRGNKLRIGQRLQVPDRDGGGYRVVSNNKVKPKKAVVAAQKTDSEDPKPEITTASGTYYIVQPGDTLTAIADDYGSSVEELRKMNKLKRRSFLKVGTRLKVPKDEGLPSDPSGGKSPADEVQTKTGSDESSQIQISKNNRNVAAKVRVHTVRRGENLTLIAKKYGVTVLDIKRENKLNRKAVVRVGARLKIPSQQTFGTSSRQRSPATKNPRVHIVRRGENLHIIARKYSVTPQQLKNKNQLVQPGKLFVGSRILIPSSQAN